MAENLYWFAVAITHPWLLFMYALALIFLGVVAIAARIERSKRKGS